MPAWHEYYQGLILEGVEAYRIIERITRLQPLRLRLITGNEERPIWIYVRLRTLTPISEPDSYARLELSLRICFENERIPIFTVEGRRSSVNHFPNGLIPPGIKPGIEFTAEFVFCPDACDYTCTKLPAEIFQDGGPGDEQSTS